MIFLCFVYSYIIYLDKVTENSWLIFSSVWSTGRNSKQQRYIVLHLSECSPNLSTGGIFSRLSFPPLYHLRVLLLFSIFYPKSWSGCIFIRFLPLVFSSLEIFPLILPSTRTSNCLELDPESEYPSNADRG